MDLTNQILNQRRKGYFPLCDDCDKPITLEHEKINIILHPLNRNAKTINVYHKICYDKIKKGIKVI